MRVSPVRVAHRLLRRGRAGSKDSLFNVMLMARVADELRQLENYEEELPLRERILEFCDRQYPAPVPIYTQGFFEDHPELAVVGSKFYLYTCLVALGQYQAADTLITHVETSWQLRPISGLTSAGLTSFSLSCASTSFCMTTTNLDGENMDSGIQPTQDNVSVEHILPRRGGAGLAGIRQQWELRRSRCFPRRCGSLDWHHLGSNADAESRRSGAQRRVVHEQRVHRGRIDHGRISHQAIQQLAAVLQQGPSRLRQLAGGLLVHPPTRLCR